jgi:hypothetical protein
LDATQTLSVNTPKPDIPAIRLELYETDIPRDVLPEGENGEVLCTPTSAKIIVGDDQLSIQLIGTFPDAYYCYGSEPDFDDANPPLVHMSIQKENIIRSEVGGSRNHYPTLVLLIKDPLGVMDEGFRLTFVGRDTNNPTYWIKVMVNALRERYASPSARPTSYRWTIFHSDRNENLFVAYPKKRGCVSVISISLEVNKTGASRLRTNYQHGHYQAPFSSSCQRKAFTSPDEVGFEHSLFGVS